MRVWGFSLTRLMPMDMTANARGDRSERKQEIRRWTYNFVVNAVMVWQLTRTGSWQPFHPSRPDHALGDASIHVFGSIAVALAVGSDA